VASRAFGRCAWYDAAPPISGMTAAALDIFLHLEENGLIKPFRIIGGDAYPANWVLGRFDDASTRLPHIIPKSDGHTMRAGRRVPALETVHDHREVKYFLVEEEVTHTPEKRDQAIEVARWGLARKRNTPLLTPR
jgi:hypothetical protein